MAGGSIGGFFVNLGMNIDKSSFNAAENALKGFENTAGKITRALGVTTGSMFAMAKAAGAMETAEQKAARAIGVSASKLTEWKTAAGIAGTSGAAFIGTMTQLEAKMQKMKLGQVDQNLAKNLGFLGLNYNDFSKMNSDQRMRAVFNKADGMQDQQKAALLISETLGSGAREFYDYLKLSGKTLDQQLAEGRALNFTTEKSKKEAMLFNQEINAVAQGAKSIATFLGSNIAAKLTPAAVKIKEILMSNRELIQSGIIGFTDKLGTAVNGIIGFMGKVGPIVSGLIDRFGGLDKIIVKIGIGVAAGKLAKVAGGVLQVVSSVGLLKTALAGIGSGLLAGGLFLALEDLAVYFMGGDSLIGYIIDNLDELKEKFNININASGFKELGAAIGSLVEKITGAKDIKTGLETIGKGFAGLALDNIERTINLLGKLAEIIADLAGGKWEELGKDIKDFFLQWADGVKNTMNINAGSSAATQAGADTEAAGGSSVDVNIAKFNAFMRTLPLWGDLTHLGDYLGVYAGTLSPEEYEYFWGTKENPESGIIPTAKKDAKTKKKKEAKSVEDGIMRPDGTVTRVAPDDWVFAARRVEDLAAAFIPQGMVQNTMNAPASYVINQNINVSGGNNMAAAVKQQAYNGANEAMLRSMNNSQRILQLMPGQR